MTRTLTSYNRPPSSFGAPHQVELHDNEARYRSVVANSPYGIYRVSLDGRFVAVNRAFCAIVGHDHDELMASNIGALYVDPTERTRLLTDVGDRPQGSPVELEWKHRDGRTITIRVWIYADRDNRGMVTCLDGYVEDVTPIRATEKALRQAEKLAALGQLVSGVAHELNNPLSAILLFTEDLLATERPVEDRESLGIIAQQARRSRAIVRDLLSFVRSREVIRELVEPMEFFDQLQRTLLPQFAQLQVKLEVALDRSVSVIHVDRAGMEQVVTNLLVNGAQAAGVDGTVRLRTARVGAEYLIEVVDDGGGVPPDLLPRIFEPFFTTKPMGQGTGLGLSVSLGLVQQHGGTITVENCDPVNGRGACFTVRLPLPVDSLVVGNAPTTTSGDDGTPRARHVLIVDDEETIRSALSRFYSRRGWAVSEAADGAEALRKIVDSGTSFDLVVSDVKMPTVSGIELHAALGTARPELLPRMIFCTGEVESRAVASFLAESNCRVLLKPFDLRTLAAVSDEVVALNSAASAP